MKCEDRCELHWSGVVCAGNLAKFKIFSLQSACAVRVQNLLNFVGI